MTLTKNKTTTKQQQKLDSPVQILIVTVYMDRFIEILNNRPKIPRFVCLLFFFCFCENPVLPVEKKSRLSGENTIILNGRYSRKFSVNNYFLIRYICTDTFALWICLYLTAGLLLSANVTSGQAVVKFVGNSTCLKVACIPRYVDCESEDPTLPMLTAEQLADLELAEQERATATFVSEGMERFLATGLAYENDPMPFQPIEFTERQKIILQRFHR